MADPRNTDPADRDPRERGLERRSGGPAVSPWLVVFLIVMLVGGTYAVSSLLSG